MYNALALMTLTQCAFWVPSHYSSLLLNWNPLSWGLPFPSPDPWAVQPLPPPAPASCSSCSFFRVHMSFSSWHLSLSVVFSRLTCAFANDRISVFTTVVCYCAYVQYFLDLFFCGWGCFCIFCVDKDTVRNVARGLSKMPISVRLPFRLNWNP